MFHDGDNGKSLMGGRVKIHHGYRSNWKERLQPAIGRKEKDLIVVTFSLPHGDSELTRRLLATREGKTVLIYNSKFSDNPVLENLRKAGVITIGKEDVHAKMALISPDVVSVGSENFPYSAWFECGISVKDKSAYDYSLNMISFWLGYNPLTNEIKKSCSNCEYFKKKYGKHGEIIQGDCSTADLDNLENVCEKYKLQDRNNYGLIRESAVTPWKHTCSECKFSFEFDDGYVCKPAGKFIQKSRIEWEPTCIYFQFGTEEK